jgi:hypothetical protein
MLLWPHQFQISSTFSSRYSHLLRREYTIGYFGRINIRPRQLLSILSLLRNHNKPFMARTRSSTQQQGHKTPPSLPSSTGKSSASKSKNRVSVTKPLQTHSPAARRPPSTSPSLRSPRLLSEDEGSLSTTSIHGGLPLNIQKELAQDIEKAGGIKLLFAKDHFLDRLCNEREDVYGRRGQSIRQQIQKKVYRWKAYDQEGTYVDKVLNRLKVKSTANLKKSAKKLQFQQEDDAGLSDSESSSGSSLSSTSSQDSASLPLPKRVFAAPLPSKEPPAAVELPTMSHDKQTHSRNTRTELPSDCCEFKSWLCLFVIIPCPHLSLS